MRILDGGYGTLLQHHLHGDETVDDLSVRSPDVMLDAHRSYLEAGARALQTNTFLTHARDSARRRRLLLDAATSCARDARAQLPIAAGTCVHVFGTVGPAGHEPSAYWQLMERFVELQVDAVLVETITSARQARAAIAAWRDVAPGVDDVVLRLGLSPLQPGDAAASQWVLDVAAAADEAVSIGMNCCRGPVGLRPLLQDLCSARGTAWVAPSAGVPAAPGERSPLADPHRWGAAAAALVAGLPVEAAGGCCGTTPDSIAQLVRCVESM